MTREQDFGRDFTGGWCMLSAHHLHGTTALHKAYWLPCYSWAGIAQSVEHLSGFTVWGSHMHDRSWSWAPPMLVCKYVDVNGLAAMMAANRSAGVPPEVNLRILLCTGNEEYKLGDPPLKPRADITRSPKQGYPWPDKKGLISSKILFLKKKLFFFPSFPRCIPPSSLWRSWKHFVIWVNVFTLTVKLPDYLFFDKKT